MSDSLNRSLAQADERDLERATRALLRRPLLLASENPETFRLVRQHATTLRDWFDVNTGWRLRVDATVARLFKHANGRPDGTHPASDPRSGVAFGRRRYVLICLALSVLERAEQQITLGRLAEGILVAGADERLVSAGFDFQLAGRGERADLVSVVRTMIGLGVLTRVAGDEEAFMSAAGDVLYDVERPVMSVLIAAPRGPSTVAAATFDDRLDALIAEPEPTSDELRNRALRQRLTRSLLDQPVVYHEELTEPERTYLAGQRALLVRRAAQRTGLLPEIRAEGIAMVDPRDELTDVRMPEIGTDGHLALLLTEHLAALAAETTVRELEKLVRDLADEHRSHWRRDTREPGAETSLLEHALGRLVALRLVQRIDDRVRPLPALARFGLDIPRIQEALT